MTSSSRSRGEIVTLFMFVANAIISNCFSVRAVTSAIVAAPTAGVMPGMPASSGEPIEPDQSSPNSFLNQIIFADVVYIRDFTKAEAMDDEQLKHLAIIACTCYGSFDLAAHCLFRLADRKAVAPDAVELFMNSVRAAAGAV